jgi:hypothetical protein
MRNDKGQFVKGHAPTRNSKYSDEDILKEGSKYDSPSDFISNNKTLYTYAVRRKLNKLIEYKKGFKIRYYTDDEILNAGKQYDNPAEFIKSEPKLYYIAVDRKLLDKIQYKVGYIGNQVKRLVYAYEFSDNSAYVGLTYNDKKRSSEHGKNGKTSVSKHMRKTGTTPTKKIISNGYIDADEASILEEKVRLEYQSKGWNILNEKKGGGLGGNNIKWTEDELRSNAKSCNSREELKDKFSNGFITAAKKLGIYEDITKDMPYKLNYYDKSIAENIAKGYQMIKEFKSEHPSLYVIVCRNKWNKDIFKHMVNGRLKENRKINE